MSRGNLTMKRDVREVPALADYFQAAVSDSLCDDGAQSAPTPSMFSAIAHLPKLVGDVDAASKLEGINDGLL